MDKASPTIGNSFDPEPRWIAWKRRDQWRIDDATCLLVSVEPAGRLGQWIKEHWFVEEASLDREMRGG
jgi:hypothetical protein